MNFKPMKFKTIAPIAIASLGITIPVVLSQHHPYPQASPSSPMMDHRGMMHEMQVNSEFEYLTQMIPHHQEAINTAKLVLAGSDRPEMKQFAEDIIQVQTAEIEQMQTWLKTWYPGQDTTATMAPMMRDLTQLKGDALDQAFLEDMVGHHMGAVMMSNHLLSRNLVKNEPVRPFAQQIATSQNQEIEQMQTWLKDWFGVTAGMPSMGKGHGMHY
jgi:uncharacterized protein (DUF305 family)